MSPRNVYLRAKALCENKSATDAYLSLHPTAQRATAQAGGSVWANNPQIIEEMKRMLEAKKLPKINKDFIVAKYMKIILKWENELETPATLYKTRVRDADAIKALENLQKLCPEFMDRKEITSLQTMKEDDLEKAIKEKYSRFIGLRKDNTPVVSE